MAYTAYFNYPTGNTLYSKARPLDTSVWSNGVTAMSENGTTGDYSASLDESTQYVVYAQAGGSPASSDSSIGELGTDEGATLTAIKSKTDLIATVRSLIRW